MKVSAFASLFALSHALSVAELKEAANSSEIKDFMVSIRRHLHTIPELMFKEHETSAYIKKQLTDLGIQYSEGWSINKLNPSEGGTGIVADIGSGQGPVIALRADIDALAILEDVDVPFKSTNVGKMHACGHDAHTAMLLAAAKILKAREAELTGTVRLIFQPAEEGGAGAMMMVEEGVLTDVDKIFGLHQMPADQTGRILGRAGGIMAGSDFFSGAIHCKGGHGAMPHTTIDPIPALANFISAAQTIVARNIDPLQAGVVSVTRVGGSDQFNVISDKATFGGTFRSYTTEGMTTIRNRLQEIGEGIVKAHGCEKFEMVTRQIPYVPTINDAETWAEVKIDLGELNAGFEKDGTLSETAPAMPAEDFAFYLQKKPGVFFFLGAGSKEEFRYPLHSNKFNFDEDAMPTGAALLSSAAVTQMERLAKNPAIKAKKVTPLATLHERREKFVSHLKATFKPEPTCGQSGGEHKCGAVELRM